MNFWKAFSYQRTAVSFLISNPRSALFLDPGLGKTSISLATGKILKYSERIKGILLIAPLKVAYDTWPDEIHNWYNFKDTSYTILHDTNKESLWGEKKDIYIINPEGLEWLHNELLDKLKQGWKCPFDTLWIDESTKFKNFDSIRFELLCNMLPLFKRRHIMTGTPAPKSLLNLWSQIYLLDEGKSLGHNYHKFRSKYFYTDDWNKYDWKLKKEGKEEIYEAIGHLILEMSATDYLDMPELIYNNIFVHLPKETKAKYNKMENEFFAELEAGNISAPDTAQSSLKCHQMANGYVYEDIPQDLDDDEMREFRKNRKTFFVHDEKLNALSNLVDELNGKPILIAYKFKHDLKALRSLFGEDVAHIGSGTTPKQLKKIREKWNRGEIPVLLGQPVSMAHGLNLQKGGSDICWYSLDWDLEIYLQFIARIYRQGANTSQVRVHHLVSEGTVDEAMVERLGFRAKQQEDLRKALKHYRQKKLAA